MHFMVDRCLIAFGLLVVFGSTAVAHDVRRPDLNPWYEGLHRNGLLHGCSNLKDCHKTDAEMRKDNAWWARLWTPVYNNPLDPNEVPDWILGEWIKITSEAIVRDERGNPVPNPEGEAVICHDLTQVGAKVLVSPDWTVVFCFVPPFEF